MLRACFVIFFLLIGSLAPSFAHAQSRAGQMPTSANTSQNVSNVCTLAVNDMRIGINRLIQNIGRIKECSAQGRLAVRISTNPDVIECRDVTQGHHIWENQSKTVRFYDAVSSSGASGGGYGLPGYLVGIEGNPGQSVLCERTYANCDICTLSGGGSGWWLNGTCVVAQPAICMTPGNNCHPCTRPNGNPGWWWDGACVSTEPASCAGTPPDNCDPCTRPNGNPGWWWNNSCVATQPASCSGTPACEGDHCWTGVCNGATPTWQAGGWGNCQAAPQPAPFCDAGSGQRTRNVTCPPTTGTQTVYTCDAVHGCIHNGVSYNYDATRTVQGTCTNTVCGGTPLHTTEGCVFRDCETAMPNTFCDCDHEYGGLWKNNHRSYASCVSNQYNEYRRKLSFGQYCCQMFESTGCYGEPGCTEGCE